MLYRTLPSLFAVSALVMFVVAPATAAVNTLDGTVITVAAVDMVEGTVITAGEGKLTMQDQDGKKIHTLDVADEVKVTRDGREARLENLMTGDWAKITMEKRLPFQTVVVAIDARSSK